MSESISTSSGSTAAGSIATDLTSRSPEIFTVTMPPPADASTISSLSCSWAASMSCCIFCTCCIICCMFGMRGCLGISGAFLFAGELGSPAAERARRALGGRASPGISSASNSSMKRSSHSSSLSPPARRRPQRRDVVQLI